MTGILDVVGASKSFDGISALTDVDLTVDEGERVGLIGPNGAGKTTLFNCILGVIPLTAGAITFDGRDISTLPVHRRARAGIGRTFQRIELFSDTTVREHLLIAERIRNGTGSFWRDLAGRGRPTAEEIESADDVLDLLGLGDLGDAPIESLSLGKGRLVEVGRALMTEPMLLLLDEPSSGLDRSETRALVATLQSVQEDRGIRDPARGARCGAGDRLHPAELRPRFRTTHRRRPDPAGPRRPRGPTGLSRRRGRGTRRRGPLTPPMLELQDVHASYGPFRALFGVSLAVGQGEAVALLGPNGVGKTTVARVASGLVEPTAGSVLIDGEDFTHRPTHAHARAGVAHAPEGRSVFATFTVEENLVLSFREALGRGGVASGLEQAFDLFPILGKRRSQLAGTLSGGEQRILSLARVLVETPKVLIADELSLGLAPLIVDEVYTTLGTIRAAGTALLIVEQHVGPALALCDRAVLLDHGSVTWEGPADDATDVVVDRLFDTG